MSGQILDEDYKTNENKSEFDSDTIRRINLLKIDVNENIKHIKNGRIALIGLCILALFSLAITLFYNPYEASMIEIVSEVTILFLIYLGCAIGVKFNPRFALTAGLSVYLIVQLLYLLVDVSTIYKGLIVKIFVIIFLAKAVNAAFQLKKNTEKLFKLGAPLRDIELAKKLEFVQKTPRSNSK